jgi:hypothetical protein
MAAGSGFAADLALPDCIPPETNVLFGVSLRSVLDAPVVKSIRSDVQKMTADLMKSVQLSALEMMASVPAPTLEMMKNRPEPGFDPRTDVDDVIFASGVENGKPTALIVLRGRFDVSRFPGSSTSYKGVSIFGGDRQGDGSMPLGLQDSAVAVLDPYTVVMGNRAQLHAAIDRRGKPSGVSPALAEKARSIADRSEIWGVGDLPKGYLPPSGAPGQLDSIDRFEFGASLRQGLEITAEMHVRSPKDAEKMSESIQSIEAMLKNQPSASGTKFDLRASYGTIRVSIVVPEEDLKKGIEAQLNSMAAGFKRGIQVTGGEAGAALPAPRPPARPAPPKPGEIVKNDRGDTVKVTLPGGH